MASPTLCDRLVGNTSGILTPGNYLRPFEDGKFLVQLTRGGLDSFRTMYPGKVMWTKWGGFWEAELEKKDFELCQVCCQHEDFALLLLAEL